MSARVFYARCLRHGAAWCIGIRCAWRCACDASCIGPIRFVGQEECRGTA